MKTAFLHLLQDTRNFLFPKTCPVCRRRLLREEGEVCMICQCHLTRLPYRSTDCHPTLEQKFYWNRKFVRGTCHFYFTDNMRTLVHQFKYRHNGAMAFQLGKTAADEMKDSGFFNDIDCIIPVPLHWKRQLIRGYNQSEKIAQGIRSVTHTPVRTDALKRAVNNATQTHLRKDERERNVADIFEISPTAVFPPHSHVLILDDVLTTGATLNACMEAMSRIPDIRISIFALCYASDTPVGEIDFDESFDYEFVMDDPPKPA